MVWSIVHGAFFPADWLPFIVDNRETDSLMQICPPWICWSLSAWEGRGAGWNCPAGGAPHKTHESGKNLRPHELEPWCWRLASSCGQSCCFCWPAWPACGERSSLAAVCRGRTECLHSAGSPSDSRRSPAADSQTQACCQPELRTWPCGDQSPGWEQTSRVRRTQKNEHLSCLEKFAGFSFSQVMQVLFH